MTKEKIEFSWKRTLMAAILLAAYSFIWEAVAAEYGTDQEYPRQLFYINAVLLAGLCVKFELPEKWRGQLAAIIFSLSTVSCFLEIEKLHENEIGDMKFLFAALNYLLIITVFFLLHAVLNRFVLTIALGTGIFTFYGLLYSFVKEFRGNGLRAADLYAVQTAVNVAEGYSLEFTYDRIEAIMWMLLWTLLAANLHYRHKKYDRVKSCAVSTGLVCIVVSLAGNTTFMEENSVKPYLWELASSEKEHGALLDFAAGIPYLKMRSPSGYTSEIALQIESGRKSTSVQCETVSAEQKQPHMIVIMNESFADFRKLGDIQLNQNILENWDALTENVVKGYVSVPIFGGWTANSEFEFLTGFSNAFFPSGTIPYQNYVKKGTPSLNSQLKEQGYTSIFMHPMDATGWNRKNVYQALEFDHTYYLEDMEDIEYLRHVPSDRGDYEELIEKFQEQKQNGPVFLFNVTMQNHGGYTWGGMENPVQILNPQGNYSQAEEYFTLIRESDKALRELLDYFDQEQEPVVVCMFGDHYPKVEEELYDALENSSQGTQVEKTAREYQVPFMIYANYDIPEAQYENISLNYLSTLLCQTAQIPLTDYQNYLLGLYEKYPVVNVYGVKNQEGQWFTWDEAMEFEEIKEYEMVQYRNLFDKK